MLLIFISLACIPIICMHEWVSRTLITCQFYLFAAVQRTPNCAKYYNVDYHPVQYVTSCKRGRLILYNSYIFRKQRTGSKTLWYCSKYDAINCPVGLKTQGDYVVQLSEHQIHIHSPPICNRDYYLE